MESLSLINIERTPEFWERVKLAGYKAVEHLMDYNDLRGIYRLIHFLNAGKLCAALAAATTAGGAA